MKLLITFIILNIVNVVIQTVKSIATIKCGKTVAALVNAVAYGLYTVVIVYTNCELDLWAKVLIVGAANLVGVYVVKSMEEKARKDKLWKVECTMSNEQFALNEELLNHLTVPHNYIDIKTHKILNFYCATQKQSQAVKMFLEDTGAKYFVSESKTL